MTTDYPKKKLIYKPEIELRWKVKGCRREMIEDEDVRNKLIGTYAAC